MTENRKHYRLTRTVSNYDEDVDLIGLSYGRYKADFSKCRQSEEWRRQKRVRVDLQYMMRGIHTAARACGNEVAIALCAFLSGAVYGVSRGTWEKHCARSFKHPGTVRRKS